MYYSENLRALVKTPTLATQQVEGVELTQVWNDACNAGVSISSSQHFENNTSDGCWLKWLDNWKKKRKQNAFFRNVTSNIFSTILFHQSHSTQTEWRQIVDYYNSPIILKNKHFAKIFLKINFCPKPKRPIFLEKSTVRVMRLTGSAKGDTSTAHRYNPHSSFVFGSMLIFSYLPVSATRRCVFTQFLRSAEKIFPFRLILNVFFCNFNFPCLL